jgi:hypothetical protein
MTTWRKTEKTDRPLNIPIEFMNEQEGIKIGRDGTAKDVFNFAVKMQGQGARLGLLKGCIEAYHAGNNVNLFALREGTMNYMLESEVKGPVFSMKAGLDLCHALDSFVAASRNFAGLSQLSDSIAANNPSVQRLRRSRGNNR